MSETVTLEIKDHIAHLTLNRPEKMNAVTEELIADLLAGVAEIKASSARVVLLAGAGKAFCAGLDTANFQRFLSEDLDKLVMERTHGDGNAFQAFSLALHDLPIPVIAAIQGPCFGAGMQLAIAADIRVAGPEAQFSIMEMKWGLVPDMGGMVLFPRVLRSDVLRLLTFTNEVLPAERALGFGLVTELAGEAHARALQIAEAIAGKSPSAMQAAKRLIGTAESSHDRAHILMEESREQRALIGSNHQMESVMAQMQKRAAVYE
ncbi:crotonase/enoyl-CoA hydratase family protein [Celeribacter neptunius]|uniref:Enoyl-CoA hydratase/carnithine racemase n=1 Tax=Celeribacter neptunius TaxID=588602 RepID=A0A1I3PI68_9RHOB|nr:crotonase/enoyl-CoA hydratase family protein [Celeribacter neptunius]SFJ20746.1 Enoyl-CoA hydratase/carnithine racemase [Celeribacter neptunius]